MLILLTVSVFSEGKIPVDKVCIAFTTCAYIITGFISIIQLRSMKFGNIIYLLVFIGPWVSDTFAYFTGKYFGKRKLAPSISPKKTVEGSIGGILANMIGFAGYAWVLRHFFVAQ